MEVVMLMEALARVICMTVKIIAYAVLVLIGGALMAVLGARPD